jgi:hypothetical protein
MPETAKNVEKVKNNETAENGNNNGNENAMEGHEGRE